MFENRLKQFIAVFIFFVPGICSATITLPPVFSSGMVLQQQADVPLWGRSDKQTVFITTSWDHKKYEATTKDGSWKIKIHTPKAGGPYSIQLSDGEAVELTDILIGEVWLASGQSNMEMPLKGFKNQPVNNSEEVIKNAANSRLRFFIVENTSWAKPLDDCKGQWLTASPETSPGFSATAYFYAKALQEKLNVPVGIVEADWGGTVVQAWMSAENLKAFPEVLVKPMADSAYSNKNEPTGLYNAMIHPVAGYGIKGAIWYQGEQNRNEPALYAKLFPAMVKQWREEWGIGDFPFYYVQIAPYIYKDADKLPESLVKLKPFVPYLREAQLNDEKIIPNAGMAVLMDVGSEATIHPPDKESVGRRLSYLALAKTYGHKEIPFSGPVYKSMKADGRSIVLSFDYADGLYVKDKQSSNFEIAGNDKKFYPAKAVVEGATIRVSAAEVKEPLAARYAFQAWTVGDLFNKDNLPASSFRTDNWDVVVEEVKKEKEVAPVNLPDKPLELSFKSKVWHDRQQKQLFVYLSTDFAGIYESSYISKAKWINITDKFKLGTFGEDFIASGKVDLSDVVDVTKPFYIAFRYATKPTDDEKKIWSKWTVSDVQLESAGKQPVLKNGFSGWHIVLSRYYEKENRVRIRKNELELLGNDNDKTVSTVAYVVSDPITYE